MNNASQMLHEAIQSLDSAREELNRPDEDVVVFSVCHQARNAMADMMAAYLKLNGKDISGAKTLEDLRIMSAEINEQFKKLELRSMVCHPGQLDGEKCYCIDVDRVKSCLDVADECKKIVSKIPSARLSKD